MFGRFRRPRRATAATHDRSEPLEPTAAALTAWQREADALLNAKRYAEARPLYERILAAVPNDLYVVYQLAGALEGSGDLRAAADMCDRGLEIEPDQPGLLSRRGAIARACNQY